MQQYVSSKNKYDLLVVGGGINGARLTERELRYFVEQEWAQTATDVLWRRTKTGLLMSRAQQERVSRALVTA